MSTFQLLSCDIALGGDILNVVARHAFIPVTYPEMLILRYLHGESAVTQVFEVGTVEREDAAERERLVETYGSVVREKLFPGMGQRLPASDDRYKPRLVGTKANPGVETAASTPDVPVAADTPAYAPPDAPADAGLATSAEARSRRPTPVSDGAATN